MAAILAELKCRSLSKGTKIPSAPQPATETNRIGTTILHAERSRPMLLSAVGRSPATSIAWGVTPAGGGPTRNATQNGATAPAAAARTTRDPRQQKSATKYCTMRGENGAPNPAPATTKPSASP